jgi:hypothetical protein
MKSIPGEAHILNGEYDTPAIRDGAVQYVKCPNCNAEPGSPCILTLYGPWKGRPVAGYAHVARRFEYHEWQDVYGPATKTWEFQLPAKKSNEHPRLVEKLSPCFSPRRHCSRCAQCECGAPLAEHSEPPAEEPKKSNSDIDDLLG